MSHTISVIIPVLNNWGLTRNCLATLAAQSTPEIEVIVVDNASTDDTPRACPLQGNRLFGERFRYVRNEVNHNFAGACNQGAALASSDYAYFLNNDTETLTPWQGPLLDAFAEESTLGGLTPLLVYPPDSFGTERVQHAGVTFSPERKVSHLYEYYSSSHPLMNKQRRFQVLTAAALCIPTGLFRQAGGFDEGFINGFEDVELCRRLGRSGWGFTVTSQARVRHLCGQSAGRGEHERENAARLTELCTDIVSDKAELVRADGYELRLSPWLTFDMEMPLARMRELIPLLKQGDAAGLWAAVNAEPCWTDGWLALAQVYVRGGQPGKALEVLHLATQFRATPEILLPLYELAGKMNVLDCFCGLSAALEAFVVSRETRVSRLRDFRRRFRGVDAALQADADRLLATETDFYQTKVHPLEMRIKTTAA